MACIFQCTTWTLFCVHVYVSVLVMSLLRGVGVSVAGWAHRSGREGGSLQLSLQLPTGCEGHWCDSTNYRGRKPALQTFTAAAQPGSAGLNPSSTSKFTPLLPPGGLYFKSAMRKWDIIHRGSHEKKHCFDLQDVESRHALFWPPPTPG